MNTTHEEALTAGGTRPDSTIELNAAMRPPPEGLLNALMDEQALRDGRPEERRSLIAYAGGVTPMIPKLKKGVYFPDDTARRRSRTDTALASAICEMLIGGVSTRKDEAAAAEPSVERMSRSRVSSLRALSDAEVDEMHGDDLDRPDARGPGQHHHARQGGVRQEAEGDVALAGIASPDRSGVTPLFGTRIEWHSLYLYATCK